MHLEQPKAIRGRWDERRVQNEPNKPLVFSLPVYRVFERSEGRALAQVCTRESMP